MKNVLLALSATLFCTGLFVPFNTFGTPKTLSDPRLYIALSLISLLIHYRKRLESKILEIEKVLPYAMIAIFFHALLYKFFAWKGLELSGFDFSHYDYAIWNITAGNGPILSVSNENFYFDNVLGNHFRPILFLLAVPQFIFQSHFYVLFLQALAALFSMIILKIASEDLFPEKSLIKFLFVVGLSFNIYYLNVFKFLFQAEVFYIPLSMLLVFSVYKRNWKLLGLTSVFFLAIKEDAPLLLLSVWGMFILWGRSKRATLIGAVGIIACILYYLAVTKYWMPIWQLREESSFAGLWGKYGNSMTEIVKGALLNPHLVLKDIFANKSVYLLLLSLGFLPLLTPMLLCATISIVILTTADYPQLNGFGVYYSAYVVGFFYISGLIGLNRIQKYQTIIASVALLIGMLMGLGKYYIPTPNFTLFNEAKNLGQYIDEGCEHVYISGNLLPAISYKSNLRRISDVEDTLQYSCQIVFQKSSNSIPMSAEQSRLLLNEIRNKFTIVDYESEHFLVARK